MDEDEKNGVTGSKETRGEGTEGKRVRGGRKGRMEGNKGKVRKKAKV